MIAGVEDVEWTELRRPAPPWELDLAPLQDELAHFSREKLPKGVRVGVAVGSRGISRLPEVVETVVRALSAGGAHPVLIPAMGSHGGATAPGQVEVLRELGVHPTDLGVPVDPSMEVADVGRLSSGQTVYLAKAALACDAVVPISRVKPHTDFRAPVESGITKMLTIGLGKELGASSLHSAGFGAFASVLPEALQSVLGALRVPFALALVEDSWHRLALAEVVPGEHLLERDEELLKKAWERFGSLPFAELDVLVLRELGKTVSGAGMDPNVTGRFPYQDLPAPTRTGRLAVLDLRDDSGGNAIGVGAADIVTERLRDKIDWGATYANAMASKSLSAARLPIVAKSDAEAISLALASLVGNGTRVAAAANTLEVTHLAVTAPLVETAKAAGYEVVSGPTRAVFSQEGELIRIGGLPFFGQEVN